MLCHRPVSERMASAVSERVTEPGERRVPIESVHHHLVHTLATYVSLRLNDHCGRIAAAEERPTTASGSASRALPCGYEGFQSAPGPTLSPSRERAIACPSARPPATRAHHERCTGHPARAPHLHDRKSTDLSWTEKSSATSSSSQLSSQSELSPGALPSALAAPASLAPYVSFSSQSVARAHQRVP